MGLHWSESHQCRRFFLQAEDCKVLVVQGPKMALAGIAQKHSFMVAHQLALKACSSEGKQLADWIM